MLESGAWSSSACEDCKSTQHGGYLQEVDEVAEHQSVELRQRLHHSDGRHWVVTVTDTLLVEVHGDERFL